MTATRIYHLCRSSDWQSAVRTGVYQGSEQDRADGFLHFSTADQVEESAARHRAGESGLMLLAVDPGLLGDALRWEANPAGEMYPHLYAALPLSAILEVVPLTLDPGGHHEFPLLTD